MKHHQTKLRLDPLIFDYFAGGGGASHGIARAVGRGPCVAINHDPAAIAMHAANHPDTLHMAEDVWRVDPVRDLPRGPVWLSWFSPTCTHFSRARGGKPVSKQLRSLPWSMVKLAAHRRPEIMFLENVPEFLTWGPVSNGVVVESAKGRTFRRFVRDLQKLGYVVDWRILNAADYGAPTLRKRLVLIARRDGNPIVWPEPTHGPGRPLPYRSAAECVDWSLPCPSIFDRARPLAEATLRRVAEGIRRFVLATPRPFIVQVNHGRDVNRSRSVDAPMPTISTKHGFGLVTPTLIQTGYGERQGQSPRVLGLHAPLGTIVAGGAKHALVSAFLAKHYGGVVGHGLERPLGTVTTVDHHSLVACHITQYNGMSVGQRPDVPINTITKVPRFGLVAALLTRMGVVEPCDAVTVDVDGETYAIADIGLRMLSPRELARAQGFPDSYVLTGTQAQQVARIGNSVSPPMAEAVVRANVGARKAEAAE